MKRCISIFLAFCLLLPLCFSVVSADSFDLFEIASTASAIPVVGSLLFRNRNYSGIWNDMSFTIQEEYLPSLNTSGLPTQKYSSTGFGLSYLGFNGIGGLNGGSYSVLLALDFYGELPLDSGAKPNYTDIYTYFRTCDLKVGNKYIHPTVVVGSSSSVSKYPDINYWFSVWVKWDLHFGQNFFGNIELSSPSSMGFTLPASTWMIDCAGFNVVFYDGFVSNDIFQAISSFSSAFDDFFAAYDSGSGSSNSALAAILSLLQSNVPSINSSSSSSNNFLSNLYRYLADPSAGSWGPSGFNGSFYHYLFSTLLSTDNIIDYYFGNDLSTVEILEDESSGFLKVLETYLYSINNALSALLYDRVEFRSDPDVAIASDLKDTLDDQDGFQTVGGIGGTVNSIVDPGAAGTMFNGIDNGFMWFTNQCKNDIDAVPRIRGVGYVPVTNYLDQYYDDVASYMGGE